jgi:hypothetical protein
MCKSPNAYLREKLFEKRIVDRNEVCFLSPPLDLAV